MIRNLTFAISLIFSLLCLALAAQGQASFEVPQNITLKTKDDYPKYEAAMIEAAKWLEATDLDKETDKRQQVNTFVIQWLSGSPNVSVAISEQLGKIYGNNPQLLAIYLASYARYYLENKGTANPSAATKAALVSMMKVYQKGLGITKSKEMEKLIKLTAEGKLEEYIEKKLN
jgi:hypothetical protein